MQQNNNYSVLPWYSSLEEQNHRKSYAYGNIYPLYAQRDFLLPFQIVREHGTATLEDVTCRLVSMSGAEQDITQQIKDAGLHVYNFAGLNVDVIEYNANLPMSLNMAQGRYYLILNDGINTYYSEVITAVQDVQPYLKIEWYDNENLVFDAGLIDYEHGYKNVLYLCTELGKPDYTFIEEGEDRDGYFFPEKQLSEKRYKCSILASEYLCDVMRFIRMADHVRITDKYGRKYNADTFLITPKWEEQGDLASVAIEFQTDTIVKKIGKAVYPHILGDFNDDYNNDFNN